MTSPTSPNPSPSTVPAVKFRKALIDEDRRRRELQDDSDGVSPARWRQVDVCLPPGASDLLHRSGFRDLTAESLLAIITTGMDRLVGEITRLVGLCNPHLATYPNAVSVLFSPIAVPLGALSNANIVPSLLWPAPFLYSSITVIAHRSIQSTSIAWYSTRLDNSACAPRTHSDME